MPYHDHAQTQAAKMQKLLKYSGVHCKNTEINIFVYGGKRVNVVSQKYELDIIRYMLELKYIVNQYHLSK